MRVGRRLTVLVVAGAVVATATLAIRARLSLTLSPVPARSPSCLITGSTGRLQLDLAQAANAATIAAAGRRLGVTDAAVTVAFVAALQESKLRNLPYGDLDSLGLFQQRPSQGWGTPSQLVDPDYAASAFYRALLKVPGWEALPVGDAAQAVQRSNGPDAYGLWEHQGRMLADAFTGASGDAFACHFDAPAPGAATAPFDDAIAAELGASSLDVALPGPVGWSVASWLVGHAYDYGLTAVTYLGERWTPSSGSWERAGTPGAEVRVERAAPGRQP